MHYDSTSSGLFHIRGLIVLYFIYESIVLNLNIITLYFLL